jgi:glyoxylase-like metal-dependent hydrolase (beta-lactamase superfamily II)
MKPGLKRALKIAVAVILVLIAVPAAVVASAFIGTSAIQDGRELDPAVRLVKDGFVTIGVIDVGGGKVALVDAGVDKEGKAILAELSRRNLGPDAVSAILLTHGHNDHLAGCHLFPAAPVYALAADVALAEGRESGKSPIGRVMGHKPTGITIARGLVDGETLTLGNRAVRVFAIPGHTAGSAAYLVNGVLFLGDSAGSSKDGKILGAPKAFSDDGDQNRASLKALADRLRPEAAGVKYLVPAHSGALEGLGPLLAFTP